MEKFEDYLKTLAGENYTGTDDNMPDAFEAWLERRDTEDWIKMGQLFAERCYLAGKEEILRGLEPHIEAVKKIESIFSDAKVKDF